MEAPDAPLSPVNLSNSAEVTIREAAKIIIGITGSNLPIEYRSLPIDGPRKRRPDIDLAKRALDWMPHVPLMEGLPKTVGYFDEVLTRSNERFGVEAL
jgi:UDP-glucuronate decarboxylase